MKKKSAKKAAERFKALSKDIKEFIAEISETNPSDKHLSWIHDYAIIRLYRGFETLVLDCLVCAINNDTTQLSEKKGFQFPKHLTDEVCEYLIVGERYFDFKGKSGLVSIAKSYLADDHYFLETIKDAKYTRALDQLFALRNFAAHDSGKSKKAALKSVELERMKSAGSYVKLQDRYVRIADRLEELADEIHAKAPY